MDCLYDDLENFTEVDDIVKLKEQNKLLEQQLEEKNEVIQKLTQDFDNLMQNYKTMETNYSSLLKTARAEIERKTNAILDLNREKDKLVIQTRTKQFNNCLRTYNQQPAKRKAEEVPIVENKKVKTDCASKDKDKNDVRRKNVLEKENQTIPRDERRPTKSDNDITDERSEVKSAVNKATEQWLSDNTPKSSSEEADQLSKRVRPKSPEASHKDSLLEQRHENTTMPTKAPDLSKLKFRRKSRDASRTHPESPSEDREYNPMNYFSPEKTRRSSYDDDTRKTNGKDKTNKRSILETLFEDLDPPIKDSERPPAMRTLERRKFTTQERESVDLRDKIKAKRKERDSKDHKDVKISAKDKEKDDSLKIGDKRFEKDKFRDRLSSSSSNEHMDKESKKERSEKDTERDDSLRKSDKTFKKDITRDSLSSKISYKHMDKESKLQRSEKDKARDESLRKSDNRYEKDTTRDSLSSKISNEHMNKDRKIEKTSNSKDTQYLKTEFDQKKYKDHPRSPSRPRSYERDPRTNRKSQERHRNKWKDVERVSEDHSRRYNDRSDRKHSTRYTPDNDRFYSSRTSRKDNIRKRDRDNDKKRSRSTGVYLKKERRYTPEIIEERPSSSASNYDRSLRSCSTGSSEVVFKKERRCTPEIIEERPVLSGSNINANLKSSSTESTGKVLKKERCTPETAKPASSESKSLTEGGLMFLKKERTCTPEVTQERPASPEINFDRTRCNSTGSSRSKGSPHREKGCIDIPKENNTILKDPRINHHKYIKNGKFDPKITPQCLKTLHYENSWQATTDVKIEKFSPQNFWEATTAEFEEKSFEDGVFEPVFEERTLEEGELESESNYPLLNKIFKENYVKQNHIKDDFEKEDVNQAGFSAMEDFTGKIDKLKSEDTIKCENTNLANDKIIVNKQEGSDLVTSVTLNEPKHRKDKNLDISHLEYSINKFTNSDYEDDKESSNEKVVDYLERKREKIVNELHSLGNAVSNSEVQTQSENVHKIEFLNEIGIEISKRKAVDSEFLDDKRENDINDEYLDDKSCSNENKNSIVFHSEEANLESPIAEINSEVITKSEIDINPTAIQDSHYSDDQSSSNIKLTFEDLGIVEEDNSIKTDKLEDLDESFDDYNNDTSDINNTSSALHENQLIANVKKEENLSINSVPIMFTLKRRPRKKKTKLT